MGSSPPPLAYRLLLGALLRTLRERTGMTPAEVAERLGWYVRKVNLVETGQRKVVLTEIDRLIELYKVSDEEEQRVRDLGREARKRDTASTPVAEWAQIYVAMESAARELRVYHEELLPGFAQTEEYAREILSHGFLPPKRGVDDAVLRRLERQQHITGPDAPTVAMVLAESALRREVGGREIMRRQVQFLRNLAVLPHISLRVLPNSAGAHAGLGTSFNLLYVGEPATTFAYAESLTDGQWYDRAPHTESYTIAFDRVFRAALPEDDTLTLLDQVINDLS
ncbi:Helix-turn-helix domain-containing protein [Streptoalloteichus tenebrarius]|uniref:Helix-turn-helix domain-containing protein n=1 Tax=Streptoalloteichus tenebrarius (strain ATCC 17920 / DSM 40477 / JCM 4838 / CBS 697.72 / NBRC 16177 / NCIMB 11028 / NRRL B-12390 / A12253. 1 / ISP 5477) TaxID=1933 RepID=A0ABT1HWX0_STRSD|nr:helix-turn-helix transcriptional regulator [Streptoalloteichus tenebrarius]MCP2260011.1 Helix-turn-helix domain-containing protein [Streptoalloteichus tenebrarius]BFF03876.1 helix-turn-helix transcriptional regulator [Streptoalloteichus tenebrarius]